MALHVRLAGQDVDLDRGSVRTGAAGRTVRSGQRIGDVGLLIPVIRVGEAGADLIPVTCAVVVAVAVARVGAGVGRGDIDAGVGLDGVVQSLSAEVEMFSCSLGRMRAYFVGIQRPRSMWMRFNSKVCLPTSVW